MHECLCVIADRVGATKKGLGELSWKLFHLMNNYQTPNVENSPKCDEFESALSTFVNNLVNSLDGFLATLLPDNNYHKIFDFIKSNMKIQHQVVDEYMDEQQDEEQRIAYDKCLICQSKMIDNRTNKRTHIEKNTKIKIQANMMKE